MPASWARPLSPASCSSPGPRASGLRRPWGQRPEGPEARSLRPEASFPMLPRALAYPATRRDATFDIFHGTRVDDPYRWLEDPESPETVSWTDAQNALTRRLVDGPLREGVRAELLTLYDYPRSSAPVSRHGRYFFTRNAGLQDQ